MILEFNTVNKIVWRAGLAAVFKMICHLWNCNWGVPRIVFLGTKSGNSKLFQWIVNNFEYERVLNASLRLDWIELDRSQWEFCGRCRPRPVFEFFKIFGKLGIYSAKFIEINNIKLYLQGLYEMLSHVLFDRNTPRERVTWSLLFRWNSLRCLSSFHTVMKVLMHRNLNGQVFWSQSLSCYSHVIADSVSLWLSVINMRVLAQC